MSASPPRRSAIDTLVARDHTAVFWFVVAIIVAGACAWYVNLMSQVYVKRPPFVVMDTAGAYYIPPGVAYQDMTTMHEQLSEMALETILERDKEGLTYLERLPKLFTKPAQDMLMKNVESEAGYFLSQNATQSFQIEKLYFIDRKSTVVATEATGIARRVSFLEGSRQVGNYRFRITLGWRLNDALQSNKAYPSVVDQFIIRDFTRLDEAETAEAEAAVNQAEAERAVETEAAAAKARAKADEAAAEQAKAVEAIRKATSK
ncbi:MAG: hypothetical protein NTV80_00090 [Verrucomicrobia bacterium]|nr:hypothetical protein [Verrucomicrobiota bacterium]